MSLSKKDKEQLISIEKQEAIEKPFNDKIKKLNDDRIKALIDANLLYIDSGCGKLHPEIEPFYHETNAIIKSILRE